MLASIRRTLALLPPLRGARVLAAASGGADSTALVMALAEAGAKTEVFHVHHGIRGASADADLDAVRELAGRNSLPFRFARVDAPAAARAGGVSLEMAARRLRRDALLADALAHGIPFIATGHTADDQAETVLLRVARGTSPAGLAAIRRVVRDPAHPAVTWLRPLLDTAHADLAGDLARRGIPWREDPSNASPVHRRNRVRHALLPAIADSLNPRVVDALCRLADTAAAESDLLDALSAALAIPSSGDRLAALDALASHPALLARRALADLLASRSASPPTRMSVLAAARSRAAGKTFPDPGKTENSGSMPWKISGNLLPCRGKSPNLPSMPWENGEFGFHAVELSAEAPLELWRDASGAAIRASLDFGWTPDPFSVYLSRNAIPDAAPVVLRRPRPGDRLELAGLDGTKKLSDIFVDLKVPREARPLAVVVEAGGTCAALAGWRIAAPFAVPSRDAPSIRLAFSPGGKNGTRDG